MRTVYSILLPLLMIGSLARSEEVLSVCDLLSNAAKYAGTEVSVRGTVVEEGLLAGDCRSVLIVNGRERPWTVLISIPMSYTGSALPKVVENEEIAATFRGRFEFQAEEESFGTHRKFGARLITTDIKDISLVVPSFLSVCDLLLRRKEHEGSVVRVRGIIRPAASGADRRPG